MQTKMYFGMVILKYKQYAYAIEMLY